MGVRLFKGVNWEGREADHKPSSSAVVKNGGDALLFFVCVHGMYRGKFIFLNLRTLWRSAVRLTPRPL